MNSRRASDNGLLQNILGKSPRLFSYFNPIAQLDRILPDQASLCCDSEKALCCSVINSSSSDDTPTPKSSAELEEEIATLELEILHLERHLLSLYRTAFQGCAFPSTPDSHIQFMTRSPLKVVQKQPRSSLELQMHRGGPFRHDRTSPSHSRFHSDHHSSATSIKATPKRDQKTADSRHRSRSLGDHLGASRIDSSLNTPDRVSEDIVRCISSIYCKLAAPQAQVALSASPTSSLASSSIFSSKNPCDSWSPHCNDDATTDHEGFKDNNGPYTTMIEVLKICLDDDSFNYAAQMLQNFRSLVRSLEKVDVLKMKREEKLVFWINIHNALVMHAFLAYGTHNHAKSTSILKAAYNIGGHFINAYVIQSSILGIRAHHAAPWLQSLLHSGKKFKAGSLRHIYALEYPEPLVHFALCSGAYSDPAVRAYTAKSIFQDLKLAKREFIQASVYTDNDTKVYLPKILEYFAKDMSLSIRGLLEEIEECLSEIQKKAISSCMKGRLEDKSVHWQPQSSTFRVALANVKRRLKSQEEQESQAIDIHFVILVSRQGKVRLTKWFSTYSQKERSKVMRELSGIILNRGPKLCNFIEWRGLKVVYKRYASLYFCMCIDQEDNELEILEIIHHYVEILDRYFGSVCELDLIFNFHKAYYILDELLLAGELQESSKRAIGRMIAIHDRFVEAAKEEASSISNLLAQVNM